MSTSNTITGGSYVGGSVSIRGTPGSARRRSVAPRERVTEVVHLDGVPVREVHSTRAVYVSRDGTRCVRSMGRMHELDRDNRYATHSWTVPQGQPPGEAVPSDALPVLRWVDAADVDLDELTRRGESLRRLGLVALVETTVAMDLDRTFSFRDGRLVVRDEPVVRLMLVPTGRKD